MLSSKGSLIFSIFTWKLGAFISFSILTNKWLSSLNIRLKIWICCGIFVDTEEEYKGAYTDTCFNKLSFSDSWKHSKLRFSLCILLIHMFSKFKIKKCHVIVIEMGCKFCWNRSSSVDTLPLWMVIFLFSKLTNILNKVLSLFKTIKIKCLR